MSEGLTDIERRLWRTFLAANVRLLERLDHELQQRSHLSLTDFEILTALSEAPGHRLRMSDLAERVLVSRSRLTYRVDRLAAARLVTRQECEDDRRGLYASLTETGCDALLRAAAGHRSDIRTWFLDAIDDHEITTMAEVMGRIYEKLATN